MEIVYGMVPPLGWMMMMSLPISSSIGSENSEWFAPVDAMIRVPSPGRSAPNPLIWLGKSLIVSKV